MYIVEIKLPESNKLFKYKSKNKLDIDQSVVIDSAGVLSVAKVISTEEGMCCKHKDVIRVANKKDLEKQKQLLVKAESMKKEIVKISTVMHKEMNIKNIIIGLDGKALKVVYTSPNMIMFNDFVKKIGSKFKMRVNMQQLNPREQAASTDTYGVCGQKLCCSSMLKKIPSVKVSTIRKQDITINPSNNNGCCGKLKCCFNYESETYKEWKDENPKKNSMIKYKGEKFKLVSVNYFSKEAFIKDKKGNQQKVLVSDIEELKN